MATPNELSIDRSRTLRKGLVKKRKRRWMRRLRDLARLSMVVCLAYGVYWLWGSPVWEWQGQIRVTGNRLVSQEEILQRLNVPSGTPLYRLNPDWIQTQLEGMPTVSRVAVRRWLFPSRLEITIIERQALVGLLGTGGNGRWMDQEGVVFRASPKVMKPRFPIQVWSDLQPGERLSPAVQAPLFDLLATWPSAQAGRVDVRNTQDVYASIDGWPVRLGEVKEIPTKIGMFQSLKPLAAKYKDRLQYIDLRYPMSPTFKLKTGASVNVEKPKGSNPASPKPKASPP